jgi:hypothetical protein
MHCVAAQRSTDIQGFFPQLALSQSAAPVPQQETLPNAIKQLYTTQPLLLQSLASTRPARSKTNKICVPEPEVKTCSTLDRQLHTTTHITFARPPPYPSQSSNTVLGLPVSGCLNLGSPSGRFQVYTYMSDPIFQN